MFGLRLCMCVDIKAKNLFHCDHGDTVLFIILVFILQTGARESVEREGGFDFIEI